MEVPSTEPVDKNTDFLPAMLLLLEATEPDESVIPEEPELIWADSYAVGGQCYCNSNFDGGAGEKLIDTPYGEMTVRQACAETGPGPGSESAGALLYNDVQCGNGPANDEANEAFCPGRVDAGKEGCLLPAGPTWTYPDPIITVANPTISTDGGPLQNPLKGFHLGFFASCCPNDALQEVYFGNHMATVGYQNFTWADLEGPLDDDFNWEVVDQQLSDLAGSKQKHVIVQLNAEWAKGDRTGRTPPWFVNNMDRFTENIGTDLGGNEVRSHDYRSAYYQAEVKEFIAEFVNRFKDDPRIFIIQMGVVGYFGEFNVFPNDNIWLPNNIKSLFVEHYRDHVFGEVTRIDDQGNVIALDADVTDGNLVVVQGSGAEGIKSESYNGYSALTQARYPAERGYNIPIDGIGYTNGWINLDAIPEDGNNDDDIGNKDFNDPLDVERSEDDRELWTFGPIGGEWPPSREPNGTVDVEVISRDGDGNEIRDPVTGALVTEIAQVSYPVPGSLAEGVIEEWTSFWGAEAGQGKVEDYIDRGHYSFARPPQVDTISNLLGRDKWSLIPIDWNRFPENAGDLAANYPDYQNDGGDLFRKVHRMMGYNYQLSNVQHFLVADQTRIVISFDVNNVGLAAFHFDWDVEFAILDSNDTAVQIISVEDADMRTWLPGSMSTVSAAADLIFDINQPSQEYRVALRMVQPGATDTKDELWRLDENVTYVVISNDVDVVEGVWNGENQLVGGWNVLDTVQ